MDGIHTFYVQRDGQRLDRFLCAQLPRHSRAHIQLLVARHKVWRNGQLTKPSARLKKNDQVSIVLDTLVVTAPSHWQPEVGSLTILYEDDTMLVIDKPAGLVMYPAAGNSCRTLANYLLGYCPALETVPRAGIVHRLDKDTSGLLVVAKTLQTYTHLVRALQKRAIARYYAALVYGTVPTSGCIEVAIGRHPVHRQRQAVSSNGGKQALTHYVRKAIIQPISLVELKLATGRTHQIRVHMSYIGHGVVGDRLYKSAVNWKHVSATQRALLTSFPRQALHAIRLQIPHISGQLISVDSPLPIDIVALITALERHESV